MDPKTQVTSVHGHEVLDLALQPLEACFALPLVHEIAGENDRAMLDVAVAAEVNLVGDPILVAADAARDAGNAPNAVMAAAAAIVGPRRVERALACTRALIDAFAHSGLRDGRDEAFDTSEIVMDAATQALFLATPEEADDPRPEAMLEAIEARGGKSAFLKYLQGLGGRLSRDAILAAIATTIAWGPLMRKRITRLTAETLPWYLRLYGVMVGATIPGEHHQSGSLRGIPRDERFGQWTMADLCFLAMTGKKPTPEEALPLQILVGLLISNGPGSISAQGAKGAVSADGPQTPGRVQINKAMVGFLTHTGYSHGGNGFEGMAFLLDQFKDTGLKDPSDPAPRPRPEGDGDGVRASATAARRRRRRRSGPSCAPCPACITRSSRASRSTTTRASASSPSTWRGPGATTCSTPSTASWCRRSTSRGRARTSSASTSTR